MTDKKSDKGKGKSEKVKEDLPLFQRQNRNGLNSLDKKVYDTIVDTHPPPDKKPDKK
jgi:hypothetical protein